MTRADMIRALQAEYQAQRMQNEMELDMRIAEASRKDPEIARLREENRTLAFDTMKKLAVLSSQEERRAVAEGMKARGISNNAQIAFRLEQAGFARDYLELKYRCAACRDTGYVGDAPARFCDCFESHLRQMQYEDGSMSGTDQQCFACFDLSRFPEEGGQRERMRAIRMACENYADSFPNVSHTNLVFTGSGGLGKTFLLNCIYERVVSRGFSAIRITAFRLFEAMRRQHMGNTGGEMDFEELLNVPLLLIDDLGSEPMMRNITVEYLFTLMNERNAAHRHTVIATNLSPVQLKDNYGERVSSRIFDRGICQTILLTGKDLRKL